MTFIIIPGAHTPGNWSRQSQK